MLGKELKEEFRNSQLSALQKYKSAQDQCNNRSINQRIRQGESAPEIKFLDSLMESGNTPKTLYRVLENENVRERGGFIKDAAYLSTSDDVGYAMAGCFMTKNTALFIITGCDRVKSIDVVRTLDDTNNEKEFILPRNLNLKVINKRTYKKNEWDALILENQLTSLNQKEWYNIDTITIYKLKVKSCWAKIFNILI